MIPDINKIKVFAKTTPNLNSNQDGVLTRPISKPREDTMNIKELEKKVDNLEQSHELFAKTTKERFDKIDKSLEQLNSVDIRLEKIEASLKSLTEALIGAVEKPSGINATIQKIENQMAKNEDLKELKGKVDVMGDVSKIKSDVIKWLAYGFGTVVTLGVGLGIWKHFAP